MPNVIVTGAKGKMGSTTVDAINNEEALTLVAELIRGDDLKAAINDTRADIVIDFTEPSYAYQNTKTILECNARPVIGTTGFTRQQLDELIKISHEKKLGGIIAPNFCLGVILMMKFAETAAKHFDFADITELHHEKKKDAPSGTAIKTAEMINAVRKNKAIVCEEKIAGALGANCGGTPIHSIRLPGLLAHQQVMFGAPGEALTIRHDCTDRKSFMPGVIFSCKKVMALDHLVYGLEDLLI